MRIKTKKYTLYITLKQCFTKLKKKQHIYNITDINKIFANFLWKKNYIYGYTKKNYPRKITYLYLKYNTCFNNHCIKKDTKLYTVKNLYKLYKWEKNICIIVKTIKGLSTSKESFLYKIGGFSLFKLY